MAPMHVISMSDAASRDCVSTHSGFTSLRVTPRTDAALAMEHQRCYIYSPPDEDARAPKRRRVAHTEPRERQRSMRLHVYRHVWARQEAKIQASCELRAAPGCADSHRRRSTRRTRRRSTPLSASLPARTRRARPRARSSSPPASLLPVRASRRAARSSSGSAAASCTTPAAASSCSPRPRRPISRRSSSI